MMPRSSSTNFQFQKGASKNDENVDFAIGLSYY